MTALPPLHEALNRHLLPSAGWWRLLVGGPLGRRSLFLHPSGLHFRFGAGDDPERVDAIAQAVSDAVDVALVDGVTGLCSMFIDEREPGVVTARLISARVTGGMRCALPASVRLPSSAVVRLSLWAPSTGEGA